MIQTTNQLGVVSNFAQPIPSAFATRSPYRTGNEPLVAAGCSSTTELRWSPHLALIEPTEAGLEAASVRVEATKTIKDCYQNDLTTKT